MCYREYIITVKRESFSYNTNTPVSYTHLDVYKRQQWYRADRERNLPLFDSEGSILAIGQASKKLKKSDNSDNNVD